MEPSRAFEVRTASGWKRWAKRRSDSELTELNRRLKDLTQVFGQPHLHAGLGLRHMHKNIFEFRLSRDLRVVFLFLKPNTFRLEMIGNHDDVRNWVKENV